jgi:hypothetical protein
MTGLLYNATPFCSDLKGRIGMKSKTTKSISVAVQATYSAAKPISGSFLTFFVLNETCIKEIRMHLFFDEYRTEAIYLLAQRTGYLLRS